MKAKTIVLTGGGTAGHVMPNLALLPYLKQNFASIHYIGSRDGIEKGLIEKAGLPYHAVTTVKLRRSLTLENLKIPFRLHTGVREAREILSELKPDVVFSKGGFVSVPVAYAAAKLDIPLIIHESDYTPGLANRLAGKKAVTVCTSFAATAEYFKAKGVYTGTPIRDALKNGSRQKGRQALQFTNGKPVVLVMGGSQGSASINLAVRSALGRLQERYNVVHLTGKGNSVPALECDSYRQIEFTTDLADIFAATDLVVSRAGSNAINEFLTLRKPMLLIPLPKAESRGDQLVNADYFERSGFSETLQQESLTPESLVRNIGELYANADRYRNKMSAESAADGCKNVLSEILRSAKIQ